MAEEYGKEGRAYAVQHFSREAILKEFEERVLEVVLKGKREVGSRGKD